MIRHYNAAPQPRPVPVPGEGGGLLAAGVWGLLATPFSADGGTVDSASLARLTEYYLRLDLAGLTVLGVFGEAADLTGAERRVVVEVVRSLSQGTPLVVGVTSLDTKVAIGEIQNVSEVGGADIAGYLVQVNDPDPAAVVAHLSRINDETGARIVLQDYPVISGVDISVSSMVEVVGQCDFVCGIKLESAPTPMSVRGLVPECAVPIFGGLGATYLLDELACGAAGAMTGFTAPEGLVECYQAFRKGGFEQARSAWLPYLPLVNFEFQAGLSRTLRKEGLRLRGIIDHPTTRTGSATLPPDFLELLKAHLRETPHCVLAEHPE